MIQRNRSTEVAGLLPLVSIMAVLFFVIPLIRLLVFRTTGTVLQMSLISATYLFMAFAMTSLRVRNWRTHNSTLLLLGLLVPPAVAYLSSVQDAGMTTVLASLWIYLVGPAILIALGGTLTINQIKLTPRETAIRIRRWLVLSTMCLLAGISVNALDAALLGEQFYAVYADYGSAVPSLITGVPLPRLSGAYFSGLDLTFAAILLLTLIREIEGRMLTFTSLALFVVIALTFTRNSYVILLTWLLAQQLTPRLLSRAGGLAFLLMPLASILIALLLGAQVSTGDFEVSAETSSVLTRLTSWTYIYDTLLSNSANLVLGIGITQNNLVPGESTIYAIDNFFWELVCFGGGVAILSFGLMFWLIRRYALRQFHGLGHITLVIAAILPVAGLFNNMVGSTLMQALFLCCGALCAQYPKPSSCRATQRVMRQDVPRSPLAISKL
ncbi:hypothetical protein [Aquabacterium sp.]|uniref:hypothetical protein n=1 Tax=Aquabacterium sp. TaxID=1872578 RepID=UPI003B75A315